VVGSTVTSVAVTEIADILPPYTHETVPNVAIGNLGQSWLNNDHLNGKLERPNLAHRPSLKYILLSQKQ